MLRWLIIQITNSKQTPQCKQALGSVTVCHDPAVLCSSEGTVTHCSSADSIWNKIMDAAVKGFYFEYKGSKVCSKIVFNGSHIEYIDYRLTGNVFILPLDVHLSLCCYTVDYSELDLCSDISEYCFKLHRTCFILININIRYVWMTVWRRISICMDVYILKSAACSEDLREPRLQRRFKASACVCGSKTSGSYWLQRIFFDFMWIRPFTSEVLAHNAKRATCTKLLKRIGKKKHLLPNVE